MQTTLIALLLIALIAVSAYLYLNYQSQITGVPPTTTLKGTVTMGPLCPTEPCNKKPDYSNLQIVIKKPSDTTCTSTITLPPVCTDNPGGSGSCTPTSPTTTISYFPCYSTRVFAISINSDGSYFAILPPGTYFIDRNLETKVGGGIGPYTKENTTFEIIAGQTTTLDLSFDTGIR